jgi:hypothetical protein
MRKKYAGNWNGDIAARVTSMFQLGSSLMSVARRLYDAHAEKAMMRFSPTNFG